MFRGSLLTKIAKNDIIYPSTISRALKVAKVIQASILNIHSNINFLENFKFFKAIFYSFKANTFNSLRKKFQSHLRVKFMF